MNEIALIYCLGKTGAALGIIQSLTWIGFSIAGILYYYQVALISVTQSPGSTLSNNIFLIYLNKETNGEDTLVDSNVFIGFLWAYTPLSVIWLGSAAYLLWALIHKKVNHMAIGFGSNVSIVVLIAIVDLVLTIMIGIDYHYFSSEVSSPEMYRLLAAAIMMSIAARGYLLWVANVVFAGIFCSFIVKMKKQDFMSTKNEFLDAYSKPTSPWITNNFKEDPSPAFNGFENPSYDFEAERENPSYDFEAERENIPKEDQKYFDELFYEPKPQFYSPPANIPSTKKVEPTIRSPYIPPPDYTPPSTPPPKLKSALKTRNSNAYM